MRRLVLLTTIALLLAACAPPPAPAEPEDRGVAQPQAARAPKVLTMAVQNELKGFVHELSLENTRVGGVR
jgi:hypothetical protein